MKKLLLVSVLVLAIAAPAAFGQLRLEVGACAPLFRGTVSVDDGFTDYVDIIGTEFIPMLDGGVFLQADAGIVKIGVGVKARSIFLKNVIAYPAAQVEVGLGPVAIDASLGGYYFAGYDFPSKSGSFGQQDALAAELSAWFGLGKDHRLRLGGGLSGLIPLPFDLTHVPYTAFAGLRLVFD